MTNIVVLSDVILPNGLLSAAVTGRQTRRNTRVRMRNGANKINVEWQDTVREYDLDTVPLNEEAWSLLEGLLEVTAHGAYGFLMLDPKDHTVAPGQGLLWPVSAGAVVGSPGVGYGVPTLRTYRQYAAAGTTRTSTRRLSRPIGQFVVKRDAAIVPYGVDAGEISAVDNETGEVTFNADLSQAITGLTPGATTVVSFAVSALVDSFSVGQRVYISGVVGTAAAALNGLSHEITSKGALSLTLSADTTGLTASSLGTAARYPQASEALTWYGRFYVPVHFLRDATGWSLVAAGAAGSRFVEGNGLVIEELLE